MNLTDRWVSALVMSNHQAVHWSAIGAADAPDSTIFEYARQHDFIIITNDLDFPRMLAYTKMAKPSVILLRGEPLTPEARGHSLISAINECNADLEAGAILSIDWLSKPRAHLLPLV